MSIFEKAREHAVISSASSALGWDQETYMPDAAATHRAAQLSWLSSRAHELATSDAWKKDLEDAEAANTGTDAKLTANLRELRREFDRATKLPVELVARESEATSLGMHAWAEARKNNDFASFAPHLSKLVALAREKAELWGYENEPYDALLDGYERATSTAAVASLFDDLRPQLSSIAAKAVEISKAKAVPLPAGPYSIEGQMNLNRQVAEAVGFDFSAGRIDTTTHPFCTTLGPSDVRLTTRYNLEDFTSSLFGVLHEAGHGLYEQGIPGEDFGLPSGSSVSLGIHESQSRLWENHVGRSDAFWNQWYPVAQEIFPQLASYPLESFLNHVRRAEFSPIRVEADEATYDLHIILRFGLERRLVRGELEVKDVPAAWNASFEELFGFVPPDDRHGCLQDIHWSMGGLGYFSTYSLGNLNAAQLFAAARKNPEIAAATDRADYAPLLKWLRDSVHVFGATLDPADLMKQATGKAPSPEDYLAHLTQRYLA
ncbi:carboxypeptidase M32 [Luteolibacter pohnpeiensis]|uniref:Metal-dependent carboxypeptidase n=1 Tax=Luteolibacter pohnpeiensis TaxID=454153 RepID=A0A934S7Z5_9BACT|nr:carboxypeptidase M32 [Luteolibacter pohnpeiensis]MBK1881367.1 carboxypeptidase M32 [Luteolibacter pohnpeiensis]